MNLEDLKDRLKNDLLKTQERLEENSTYLSLRDRYQSLGPAAQKAVSAGAVTVLLLIILSIPFGQYSVSNDTVTEFEGKRALIRDLFKVQKETNDVPEIAAPPPAAAVKARVESDLQGARLLPEQMKGVTVLPPTDSDLIKAHQNDGVVEVNLGQLNLRQVVDLGAQFQNISPSVKMKDLIVQASTKDPRYFDVIYRLVVLKVAQEELPPPEPPTRGRGRR